MVLNSTRYIAVPDLPLHFAPEASSDTKISIPLGTSLKEMEDILIQKTLDLTKGDRTQAAKMLGVNERTIYRWIIRSKEE